VVFTGGIGENSTLIRALVAEHLKVFGILLDEAKNRCRAARVSA
jgi:propionate kinase